MDYFDVLRSRHSIRAYAATPVEQRKLQAILEAANSAPSAGNLQGYEIFVVRKPADLKALVHAALDQHFIAQAPVALVFCAHPARSSRKYGQRGVRLYSIQDATIACSFAMLAATALGLGTVWVGAFDDEAVRKAIRAPEGVVPVSILPVGYPGERPEPTERRRLQDLVQEL